MAVKPAAVAGHLDVLPAGYRTVINLPKVSQALLPRPGGDEVSLCWVEMSFACAGTELCSRGEKRSGAGRKPWACLGMLSPSLT